MNIRRRTLPEGWYPFAENEVVSQFEEWESRCSIAEGGASAVIVPHAGWYFSGFLAYRTFRELGEADTVVIVGGHLSPSDGLYLYREDGFDTPLGILEADQDLRREILQKLQPKTDFYPDNTVEIHFPLMKHFCGEARVIGLRCPPDPASVESLTTLLDQYSYSSGKKIAVAGSTDLTHYGRRYGFTVHGTGEGAVSWVREKNDKRFIDALLEGHWNRALDLAYREKSACSAGGAAAACSYGLKTGAGSGILVDHYTSNDIHPDESFVGYCGMVFRTRGQGNS